MTVSQLRTGQPDWLAEAMDRHYELLQQLRELHQLRELVDDAEAACPDEIPDSVHRWRGTDPE